MRGQGSGVIGRDIDTVLQGTGQGHRITMPSRRQEILTAMTGKDSTLAIPAAIGGAAGAAGGLAMAGDAEAAPVDPFEAELRQVAQLLQRLQAAHAAPAGPPEEARRPPMMTNALARGY